MKSDKYFIVLMVSFIGIVVCEIAAEAKSRTIDQRGRYAGQKGQKDKKSQEGPPYEITGEVISLTGNEIQVLDSTQIPKKVYRLILSEWIKMSEEITEGSTVQVTYISRHLHGHHRLRTAVSIELVSEKK